MSLSISAILLWLCLNSYIIVSELIRWSFEDNFKITSHISTKTCCDPSIEPYRQDGSNQVSQHTPIGRNLSRALNSRILTRILKTGVPETSLGKGGVP